jgi:hypothetical protein
VHIESHNCDRIFHDLPPYFWLCTWLVIHQSITHVHKGQVLFIFVQLSTIMSRILDASVRWHDRYPAGCGGELHCLGNYKYLFWAYGVSAVSVVKKFLLSPN